MKKRLISVIPALAAILTLVSCSPAAPSSSASPAGQPSGSSQQPPAEQANYQPVTFHVMIRGTADTFGVPRTAEIQAKTVKDRWNIDLKYEMVDKNTYNEKVTAKFAAADFPSILYYGDAKVIQNAIDSKVFVPVTKAVMSPEYDNVDRQLYFIRWYQNGEYYGFNYHSGAPETINLRGDWLKNLNMEVPKNPEELKEVIAAMTNNDPDQNGKNDTYGLTMQGDLGMTGQFWSMFLPAPRIIPTKGAGLYIDSKDNTVKTILDDVPNMEKALAWFNSLYQEGILDPMYVTLKQQDVEAKFVSNQSGVWVKEIGGLPSRLAQIQNNVPDAEIVAMPPVETVSGVTNYDLVAFKSDCYFMTKDAPDVERGYELLKYLYGKEGIYAEAYGEEGVEYSLQGGAFQWLNEEARERSNPARVISSYLDLQLLDPIPVVENAFQAIQGYGKLDKDIAAYATATESYNKLSADVDKVMLEGVTQIIVGEKPVDYYQQVLQEAKDIGLDSIVSDVNQVFQKG